MSSIVKFYQSYYKIIISSKINAVFYTMTTGERKGNITSFYFGNGFTLFSEKSKIFESKNQAKNNSINDLSYNNCKVTECTTKNLEDVVVPYGIDKNPFSIIKEWVDQDFSNRFYTFFYKELSKAKYRNIKYIVSVTVVACVIKNDKFSFYFGNGIGYDVKSAKNRASQDLLKKHPLIEKQLELSRIEKEDLKRIKKECIEKQLNKNNDEWDDDEEVDEEKVKWDHLTTDEKIKSLDQQLYKYFNKNNDEWDDDEEVDEERLKWNLLTTDEKIKLLDEQLNKYFS